MFVAKLNQFTRYATDRCSGRRGRGVVWLFVVAVFLGYAWLTWMKMGAYAGGSDSSGYANNAKLMLAGQLVAEQRPLAGVAVALPDYAYVPLGFKPRPDGRMAPTYPLGLSALYALASLGGTLDRGMAVAMWLMLLGSLPVAYLLARQVGLERGWALVAVAVLAACPLVLHMGLQAMSDVPAMLWTTLAIVLVWASRARRWLALLAGAAVAVAVFIRPSNALVLLPAGIVLGLDWRRWLLFGLGGLPGAALWAQTNHVLFGKYITTGYGEVGSLFSWANVGPALANYAWGLPQLVPLAPFAVIALLVGRRSGIPGRLAACLAAWVAVVFGFYVSYWFSTESWWYLRFLLPAFPALIVLSVAGLRWVARSFRGAGSHGPVRAVAAVVSVVVALVATLWVQAGMVQRFGILKVGEGERIYPEICAWTAAHVPADAVVLAMQTTGVFHYAGQFTLVRWDVLDVPLSREVYAAARRAGRPVYAVLFPFEIEDWGCFRGRLAGRWTKIGAVRYATIWRLDDPDGVMEPAR